MFIYKKRVQLGTLFFILCSLIFCQYEKSCKCYHNASEHHIKHWSFGTYAKCGENSPDD